MKTAHLVLALLLIASSTFAQKLKKVKQKLPDNVIEEFYVLKSNPEIREGTCTREDKLNGYLTEGYYHNNKKNKIWSFYEMNPKHNIHEYELKMRGKYVDGKRDNLWSYYNSGNIVIRKEFYTLGILDSVFMYDESGVKLKREVFYYNGIDSVIFQYNSNSKPVYAYDSRSDKILRYFIYTDPPLYQAKINNKWVETELDFPPLLINFEKVQNYYNTLIKSQNEERVIGPVIKGTINEYGQPVELAFIDSVRVLSGNKTLIHDAFSDSIMLFLRSKSLKWIAGHKDGYPVSTKFLLNARYSDNDISGNPVCYDSPDTSEFTIPEIMPSFPGGEMAMMNYLNNVIEYPAEAQKNGIQGRVYVNFVITKNGLIKNVKVIRGVHPLLNDEAVRVIKEMPNWIPGKTKGKPVNVSFMLPIMFSLN
ncbi:TonB family protein [Saccharicrinis sp. FJH54]|uniref:energy transducer TonB n=1 Tax=Saccharicrinis sp. FJH54 TaxID=3344665 RepID=UPI0035D41947